MKIQSSLENSRAIHPTACRRYQQARSELDRLLSEAARECAERDRRDMRLERDVRTICPERWALIVCAIRRGAKETDALCGIEDALHAAAEIVISDMPPKRRPDLRIVGGKQ